MTETKWVPRVTSKQISSSGRADALKYVQTCHTGGAYSHLAIPEVLWRADPTNDKSQERSGRVLGRFSTLITHWEGWEDVSLKGAG